MSQIPPERRPEDDPVHSSDLDWEEAGLPAQEDSTEGEPLPDTEPSPVTDRGNIDSERVTTASHDEALARERPEAAFQFGPQRVAEPEHTDEVGTPNPTARVVESDEAEPDKGQDVLAEDVTEDRAALTPEEESVRVQREE